MSSDIEARLKSSLVELNSIIKTAKHSNCDLGKLINSIKAAESPDDSLVQILDQLKSIPSEPGSFLSGQNSTCSSYSKPKNGNPKEKTENTEVNLKRCLKTIKKIKVFYEELADEAHTLKDCPENIKKIVDYGKKYLEKSIKKIKIDLKNEQGVNITNGNKEQHTKKLESQILDLHVISDRFFVDKQNELKSKSLVFYSYIQKIDEKFSNLQEKLQKLENSTKLLKASNFLTIFKKVQHYKKNYKIFNSDTSIENQNLLLVMNELLQLARPTIIHPFVEILITPEVPPESPSSHLQSTLESQILSNLQIKAELLKYEGDQTNIRQLETELQSYKQKCELLEKVNKELSSKKNDDSDDSLVLDCSNIKEAIEIQELRAALRSLSEKYEQEKEILLKDILESREDMETQIFRLQNEKNYTEVKLKGAEKLVNEMNRDKERLESIIVGLKKDVEKLKDSKIDPRLPGSRRGSSELQGSGDFELTESLDKLGVNSNDLYEVMQEELNEIVLKLQGNGLIADEGSTVQILKKAVNLLVELKKEIQKEVAEPISNQLNEDFKEVVLAFKRKISGLSVELVEKEKKIQEKERKIQEKEKKIQEFVRCEHFEIRTEPSPRMSTQGLEINSSKQLQIEKSKLLSKKHEIHLHKEQIALLKANIRELQSELEHSCKVDVLSLKDVWWNFSKEIPILSKNSEDAIELFMRKLGFSSKDLTMLTTERKSKSGKHKFGLF